MFNKDGKMDADGAKNVVKILDQYSTNVKGKGSTIDLSKTYTTEFVDQVPANKRRLNFQNDDGGAPAREQVRRRRRHRNVVRNVRSNGRA